MVLALLQGGRRGTGAVEAISRLKPNVDALITVSNDKLLEILPESVPLDEALTCADDILRQVRAHADRLR